MGNQHRLQMMARELLREISRIISFEMHDPRLGMVTVTKVDPAPDMKTAKVFISMLAEGKERDAALRGLSDARNFIRAQLREKMKSLRYIPELMFKYDESIAGSIRISKLIDKVTKEMKPEEGEAKDGEDDGEGEEAAE